jgi:UDP-N-acetyl-D-glucosamine dehydrogenase
MLVILREHVPHDQHRLGERARNHVRPHGHQCLGGHRCGGHEAVRVHAVLSGPGLGGHCIPIDPFYLSWKSNQAGIEARFIELAGYVNGQMPHFVVEKVQNAFNDEGKALKDSRVHLLGVAYKRDIDDVRESPALDIIHLLQRRGAEVSYTDPFVPVVKLDGLNLQTEDISAAAEADCVVVVTDHSAFDYRGVVNSAKLIVDTRNALKNSHPRKLSGCKTGQYQLASQQA